MAGGVKELAHKLSRRYSSEVPAEAIPGGPSSGDDGDGIAGNQPRDATDRTLRSPSRMRSGSFSTRTPSRALSRKDKQRSRREKKRAADADTRHHEAWDSEDEAAFRADWHMSRADEKVRMKEFLEVLKAAGLLRTEFDYFMYRRFLRARQHDIERAKKMWANHLKWRKEIGADTILEDFDFPERESFVSLYPQGYCNVDKKGRPIYIQQLGQLQFKKLTELTSEERMIKFHVQEYERCVRYILPACSRTAGRHVEQTFAILDMKGVGIRHVTGGIKKMLGTVLQVDQNNYPEMLGKTAIINAGAVINFVFPFVKPFLDKRTVNKIEVCPKDYTPVLLQYIERDNLPEYLGGTSKATLLDDAGPWNDQALIDEIDAGLKRPGPRLRMPDERGGFSDGTASSVEGASPREEPIALSPPANGAPRITEEEELFYEAAGIARVSARSSMRSEISDDGYASQADGYASASEGYFSAAESVSSMRSGRSLGAANSFSGPRPGFAAAGRRVSGADSDSDDEAQSRTPLIPLPGAAARAAAAPGLPAAPMARAQPGTPVTPAPAPRLGPQPPPRTPGTQLQQSIAARVATLETRLGNARAGLGDRAPPSSPPPPEGASLLARVEALEAALDTVMAAQQAALEEADRQPGCCGSCCIM